MGGPGSTRAAIRPILGRMAARAGIFGGPADTFWRVFEHLTQESLDYNSTTATQRFSGICRDGAPWQFCVSLGAQSVPGVRYLTEVGYPTQPLALRTKLAAERTAEVLGLVGVPDHRVTIQALTGLAPAEEGYLAGLWVGFAMDGEGRSRVRLYANNGWGDATARWLRLIAALRQVHARGFAANLQPLLPLLVPAFSPAGFAVTFSTAPPLCKLYLRPLADPWSTVRSVAEVVLGSGAGAFLAAIEEGFGQSLETLPGRAALLSTAGPAAGGPLDLKLDLCGHCLFAEDSAPVRVVARLGRSLGLDLSPYQAASEDFGGSGTRLPYEVMAFIGVGTTTAARNRMNVYLAPPPYRARGTLPR